MDENQRITQSLVDAVKEIQKEQRAAKELEAKIDRAMALLTKRK